MNRDDLKKRTKQFALDIVRFVESLPKRQTAEILGKQLLRSGTAVGANYRSACRAKSVADFISKMGIVEEEADESMFWMELLIASDLVRKEDLAALLDEADQLAGIAVSSIRTARKNQKMK